MVGRLGDQTVCCVFRVNVIKGKYFATLVNLFVLGKRKQTKTFNLQALELKKIIEVFKPKEVVIDTNGLIHQPLQLEIIRENPLNCWELLKQGQSAASRASGTFND